jgi:hypothetical protein
MVLTGNGQNKFLHVIVPLGKRMAKIPHVHQLSKKYSKFCVKIENLPENQ